MLIEFDLEVVIYFFEGSVRVGIEELFVWVEKIVKEFVRDCLFMDSV